MWQWAREGPEIDWPELENGENITNITFFNNKSLDEFMRSAYFLF